MGQQKSRHLLFLQKYRLFILAPRIGFVKSGATELRLLWHFSLHCTSLNRKSAIASPTTRRRRKLAMGKKKDTTQCDVIFLAPRVGFEPTTLRLTAGCSAAELSRNIMWQRPILPAGHPASTFGAAKLNFCVRNENRWTFALSSPQWLYNL